MLQIAYTMVRRTSQHTFSYTIWKIRFTNYEGFCLRVCSFSQTWPRVRSDSLPLTTVKDHFRLAIWDYDFFIGIMFLKW